MTTTNLLGFRAALIQMTVTADKPTNVANAVKRIRAAKQKGCLLAILPECFNSPYDTALFKQHSETVPDGATCKALSQAAKSNGIYIVGGSIPEMCDDKVYNTCTVWDPNGKMIAKHRKVHLFDVQISGKICFTESDAITAGNSLTTFQLGIFKIGLGICYDIRFPEMATLYRKLNCDVLLYPGNSCTAIGRLHWSLLARARAVDNQAFVAVISPARVLDSGYESWGHSMVVDPWGRVVDEATEEDTDLIVDLDIDVCENIRKLQMPTERQKRTDIYDTVHVQQ